LLLNVKVQVIFIRWYYICWS